MKRTMLLALTLFLFTNLATAQTSINARPAEKKSKTSCTCEVDSCWSLPLTLLKFPGVEEDSVYTLAARILGFDDQPDCTTVFIYFSDGTHWAFEGDKFKLISFGDPEYFVHINLDGEEMRQKLTTTRVTKFKMCQYERVIKKRDQKKLLQYFNCVRRTP